MLKTHDESLISLAEILGADERTFLVGARVPPTPRRPAVPLPSKPPGVGPFGLPVRLRSAPFRYYQMRLACDVVVEAQPAHEAAE